MCVGGWMTGVKRHRKLSQFSMSPDNRSRMTRECHVRICGGLGGQFPGATRRELLTLASRHQAKRGCSPLSRAQWRAGDGDTPGLGDERSTTRWVLVSPRWARHPVPRHQGAFGAFGPARAQSSTEFRLTIKEACVQRRQ